MDWSEKVLYHQIHPAKLAADITGSIISNYLMWHRRFGPAMLGAWVPAILGSAVLTDAPRVVLADKRADSRGLLVGGDVALVHLMRREHAAICCLRPWFMVD